MWRKSTVWLAGLMAAVLGAGCGDGGGSSSIRVRWDIAYLNGAPADCKLADTPTVSLLGQNLNTGEKFTATAPCTDNFAVLGKLPTGPYRLSVSLLDRKNREVSVVDYASIETRRNGVVEPDPAPFDIQAWDISWVIMIEPAAGGPARNSNCQEVGATDVELTWQLGNEQPESVLFACNATPARGLSPAIGTGFYQAQVRLLAGQQELSNTGFMGKEVTDDPASARINVPFAVRR